MKHEEIAQKYLKEINEAMNRAEMMADYCEFMADNEEDEKVKAQWKVKQDTYIATLNETRKGYVNFNLFLGSK